MSGTLSSAARKRGRPTAEEREQRRDQILDVAVALFVSNGYGQVTIEQIAATSRVTKRTIYTYFGDKAEVFTAAVERFRIRALDFESGEESLEDVATRLVFVLHSEDAVGLHRLMIGESAQFPELADRFYASGPGGYIRLLAGCLGERLPPHDRDHLAEALFALLLGEDHRRRLLGLRPAPTPAAARDHARAALALLQLVDGAERHR